MRLTGFPLLAVSSLLLAAAASAATRPHYGGTLRAEMRAAPLSLDPADSHSPDSVAGRNLTRLIFETLVTLDDRGRIQPDLAVSWTSEPGNQRWHFALREGVSFHDGTPLTADVAAASLRAANPQWKVFSNANSVVVEFDSSAPGSLAELALPRNAIAKRGGNALLGTGPFAIGQWQPGKELTLSANNDYWGGRPFLDSVAVDFGKSFHEQSIALDLGRADMIEIPPEQSRLAGSRQVESSAPSELMALVFSRAPQTDDEARLRQALALSLDRALLNNVMLQGGGEPTGSLLPQWMTGYAFLFPAKADLQQARQLSGGLRQTAPWTLGYDASDPVARVVAERIALNARDAGLSLQLTNSGAADLRLRRAPMESLDAPLALTDLAAELGLPAPKFAGVAPEDQYAAERTLLQSQRVIPLLHLRVSYGLSKAVHTWAMSPDGGWHLPEVWLGGGQP
jgi:peptide/nickel transport system substrate-binding protein